MNSCTTSSVRTRGETDGLHFGSRGLSDHVRKRGLPSIRNLVFHPREKATMIGAALHPALYLLTGAIVLVFVAWRRPNGKRPR